MPDAATPNRHASPGLIEAAGGGVIWVEAPGGVRLRAAHWPGGARGVVLLLNGWTEFIEKYLEPVAELQRRGFAVWTLDWRGQGLSSRLLPDPLPHHVGRFEDYLDDLDLLLDRHVLPGLEGRPLIVMGHSMGGHLAARLLARRPGLFARAILCAPMVSFLAGGPAVRTLARLLAHAVCLWPGQATRMMRGMSRLYDRPFEGNRLTGSSERYAADRALARDIPGLKLGGITWGWVRAALDSVEALQHPALLRRIDVPVVIVLAGADLVVDNAAMRGFPARLPNATLIDLPGALHELLREQGRHRLPLWAAIDGFLDPDADAT